MASSSDARAQVEARPRRGRSFRLHYERRIALYSLLVALPGIVLGLTLLWLRPWPVAVKLLLSFVELLLWWLFTLLLGLQTVRPLQTLTNVISALRAGDYSFRAGGAVAGDVLGELALEVNGLADLLADQRIRTIEATALLRRVVEEIDAPLFAFDPGQVLRLVNPAGEKLLQKPAVRLLGRSASEVGLEGCLSAPNDSLVTVPAAPSSARWMVRQSTFREHGLPHTLVVLSNVSRALREEERGAWQRLIRVLGHELNNSLAPLKSIAGSLISRLAALQLDPVHRQDFERGLSIIEARSSSLNRFLQAYRQLAQMPPPAIKETPLVPIVERVVFLETRLSVNIARGPDVALMVDADQIEQMLINLLRNAVDAALEQVPPSGTNLSDPQVTLGWALQNRAIVITIDDNGPGLLNPSNAFVPFYTTKSGGSGIGLALSRHIAEAHGGWLDLANLAGKRGCQATVRLPCSD